MDIPSIVSCAVAAIALIVSIYNNGRKDTKEVTEQISQCLIRIDSLSGDVKEIKDDFRREMAELKAANRSDHDRIIKMEMSLDTAWKRIDEIRAREV